MQNSRNLSDAEALALFRQAGCGWDITFFPADPTSRHRNDEAWYAAHLTVRIDDEDNLYFYGYAPTLGRAVLKAMINATRWALTGKRR